MPVNFVKVCCIGSVEEMLLAVGAGANALGFVSRMPSGPGPIAEELIADIVPQVPAGIATFLLTCETTSEPIVAQQRRTGVNTLQLVDAVKRGTYSNLRRELPGVAIVQVIHVAGQRSVGEALNLATEVDALLLDSGNPALMVKELGGTGRTHDWNLSRQIRERSPVPVYLAGGLTATNVVEAIRTVEPFGIDVCSGVRTAGKLDSTRLRQFVSAAKGIETTA